MSEKITNNAVPNEELDETAASPKRGRPTDKTKAKRQNFAGDLQQLKTKVTFAVGILRSANDATSSEVSAALVAEAIKFLES